jgi:hypothetical protein
MTKGTIFSLLSLLLILGLLAGAGDSVYKQMQAHNLHVKMTTPIPEKTLNNMNVLLGMKLVNFQSGLGVNLSDRHAPVMANIGQIVYGDYDHDGWLDAAMLVNETNGPTWLVIVRNVEGRPDVRRAIPLEFLADGIEFELSGAIRVTESHRWGQRSVAYGYTEPYLWKSIE